MKKEKQNQSLMAVMNEMAAGDAYPRQQSYQSLCKPEAALSELDAFCQLDSLLAALSRQYRQAKQDHAAACAEHGPDSFLSEIAADMEDSAWCAMQTRLYELRQDGAMMRDVQAMMRENLREEVEAKEAEQRREAVDFFYRMQTAKMLKERQKQPVIFEWLMFFMLLEKSNPNWGGAEPVRWAV